jgi:hypothetical protein
MTAEGIKPAVELLVNMGLLDVILPFILVFTIIFAFLQKTLVFGKENDKPRANINAMFAFVCGFFFIISLARVNILSAILQKLTLAMVMTVMLLMLVGLLGAQSLEKYLKWIFPIVFVVVLIIFSTSIGWFELLDGDTIRSYLFHPVVVGTAVFMLVVWLIARTPKGADAAKPEKKGGNKSGTEVKNIPASSLTGGKDREVWKE